jgi:hypothetical protein
MSGVDAFEGGRHHCPWHGDAVPLQLAVVPAALATDSAFNADVHASRDSEYLEGREEREAGIPSSAFN